MGLWTAHWSEPYADERDRLVAIFLRRPYQAVNPPHRQLLPIKPAKGRLPIETQM
jgi:hypothetical protein